MAAAMSDDASISFAKRLAHNNKDTRADTLKKLKRWLVTQCRKGAMNYPAMLKLWKGFYYSMWYSDKPLLQEALARDIADIMKSLPETKDSVSFLRGFCETIAREWICIDRLRLDKFHMFVKTMLRGTFEFCESHSWDAELTESVVAVLDEQIINSEKCPDSIAIFVADQLYEIHTDIPNVGFLTQLLKVYATLISKTPKKDLNRVLEGRLFGPVRSQSITIDGAVLVKHIRDISVQPGILTRNRMLLYKLGSDLSSLYDVDTAMVVDQEPNKSADDEVENQMDNSSPDDEMPEIVEGTPAPCKLSAVCEETPMASCQSSGRKLVL